MQDTRGLKLPEKGTKNKKWTPSNVYFKDFAKIESYL